MGTSYHKMTMIWPKRTFWCGQGQRLPSTHQKIGFDNCNHSWLDMTPFIIFLSHMNDAMFSIITLNMCYSNTINLFITKQCCLQHSLFVTLTICVDSRHLCNILCHISTWLVHSQPCTARHTMFCYHLSKLLDSLDTTKIIQVHLWFWECRMFGALSFCFMSCMLVYFHAKKLSVLFRSVTHCLPFLDMFVVNQQ